MSKNCVICGKPSGIYPLCREHLQMKADGKVVKCNNCGTWHLSDEVCNNCGEIHNKENHNTINDIQTEPDIAKELNCIICGKPSNGKHFCKECYFKYKDRSVDIRICHCKDTEILDDYGNRQYKCDDGRMVRSRAEKIISDFLFKEHIRSIYEKTIYYKNSKGENKELHPDFYLPDFDIYLEYNELKTKEYLVNKGYAQKIYDSLGKKVIIMTDENLFDVEAYLKPLLNLN